MIFPLKVKPGNNYKIGAGRFGANRDNGTRLHSACDLYVPEGTEVHAMESGKVVNVYDFYLGTKALSIAGTLLIRYGEITPLVKAGQTVKEGQLIAKVKKCNGINNAMLHLEIFSNPLDKSSLTDKSKPPYQRRADLINPTEILLKLEEKLNV